MYQEATGAWIILPSTLDYTPYTLWRTLGGTGYSGMPADYDGDGLTDPAVRSETSNEWIVMLSTGSYTPVHFTIVFE